MADPFRVEVGDGRGRVEQGLDPVPVAEIDRRIDGLDRHFELQQDQVALGQVLGGALDVGRQEVVVGPFDDQDRVLARRVHHDRGDTARLARHPSAMTRVDPDAGEVADRVIRECVVADLGHHQDLGPELGGRNRLVGALAAVTHLEARRLERLALGRHAGDVGDEIDHVAADYGDTARHGWGAPFWIWASIVWTSAVACARSA